MRARGEIAGGRKAIKELAKSLQLPSSPNLTSLVPAGGEEIGSFSWAIKAGEVQRPCVRRARLTGWQPCPARTHLRTLGYCAAEDVGAGGVSAACWGLRSSRYKEGLPAQYPLNLPPSQSLAHPHRRSVSCSTSLSDFRPVLVLYSREREKKWCH